MHERLQRLNTFVLTVVVFYTVWVGKQLITAPIVSPLVDSVALFLTSIGFYRLLLFAIFGLINNSRFCLRLYWGRCFVDGLWSYTYTLDAATDTTVYFGVWRFQQSLFRTVVVGFGLTPQFSERSRVCSVTDMIPSPSGGFEIVNSRTDSGDAAQTYYSRTTMHFELKKGVFLKYPTRMRGHTVVYGGIRNGLTCLNTFVRHEDAETEEDVIAKLREERQGPGQGDRA